MEVDLNGRPVKRHFISRLFRRFSSRAADISVDDPCLVVVAECFDDAQAASEILSKSTAFNVSKPAVLRHILHVPSSEIADVTTLAAEDLYRCSPAPDHGGEAGVCTGRRIYLDRVQQIDSLHISQERSRMVGLAVRHDSDVLGWQVLQLPE